jgi:hypothetical protein
MSHRIRFSRALLPTRDRYLPDQQCYPTQRKIHSGQLIDDGMRYRGFGGRVQYAHIEEPKTAQIILSHPKTLIEQVLYFQK